MASVNPYAEATLADVLDTVASRFGSREALVQGAVRLTYAELHRAVERLARGLIALGVGADDKVVAWLPNRAEWLVLQHACARIGAVLVPVHTAYRAHELDYVLRQSDAETFVLQDSELNVDFLAVLAEVLPGLDAADAGALSLDRFPALRRVVRVADAPRRGTLRYVDALAAGDGPGLDERLRARRAAVVPDGVLTLLYTSGTTSLPKGARITHRNCVPHAWEVGQRYAVCERDRMLQTLPLSGSWGLIVSLMTVAYGATLVMSEAALAGELLRLLERERITLWHAVDSTLVAVLDHPDLERHDRSTLRTLTMSTTAGGRRGLFDELVDRLGVRDVRHSYGMTEVNSQSLCQVAGDPPEVRRRVGGFPFEGLEVRVADPETGADCPAGREGELQFRGRSVTSGYHGKPEETAAAFDAAGWFRTGDLAVQDEAGRTFFLGRLRDTLRIGNLMVAPAEIEAFLMEHPGVAQAFVVGVPDARLGDAAVAYVIARPGHDVKEVDLHDHCRGRLASFKTPRRIWIVDDVPRARGPHGAKAQRAVLREMALRALGLQA